MSNSSTVASEQVQPKQIAGFWRRTFAVIIDGLVLGVPAYFLAQLAFDQLAALGQEGRLIGLAVMLLYFGIGDSSIAHGQSVGKRLLAIRVVGASGEAISLPRALLRTLVFCIPLSLNGLYFPPQAFADEGLMWFAGALIFLGLFGFGVASLYLFIFNTGTRQALHDLFLDTYVVREENAAAITSRVWAGHIVVVLILFAACLASPAYVHVQMFAGSSPLESEPYAGLGKLQQQVAAGHPDFDSVEAQTSWMSLYSTQVQKTTTYLNVNVRLKRRSNDYDAIIRDIARRVLEASPDIMGQQQLRINVFVGVDLGVLRLSDGHMESHTVEEWRRVLSDAKPASAV